MGPGVQPDEVQGKIGSFPTLITVKLMLILRNSTKIYKYGDFVEIIRVAQW